MTAYDKYRLRPIARLDLEKVLEWRNSERIRAVMFSDQPISWPQHLAWFEKIAAQTDRLSLIFELEGNPLGLVSFSQLDRLHSRCYWGFYLGEPHSPAGSGTIMGLIALEYIFEKIGIRKVCGEVLAFNQASLNFHLKLGFRQEGHFVEHLVKHGVYHDVISFAAFYKDWPGNKSRLMDLIHIANRANSI